MGDLGKTLGGSARLPLWQMRWGAGSRLHATDGALAAVVTHNQYSCDRASGGQREVRTRNRHPDLIRVSFARACPHRAQGLAWRRRGQKC